MISQEILTLCWVRVRLREEKNQIKYLIRGLHMILVSYAWWVLDVNSD